MPDISDLLTTASRTSTAGPDLQWVQQRAGVLRRRQRMARSAAACGVALVAVVLFRDVGAGTRSLEQVPADRAPRPTATPSTGLAPAPGLALAVGRPAASPAASSGPGAPQPTSVSAQGGPDSQPRPPEARPTRQPSPTAASNKNAFPPGASCSASTTTLGPDQTASCRFTATAHGGWDQTASTLSWGYTGKKEAAADIWVLRDGITTHHNVRAMSGYCGDDIVRPGDLVTVTVRQMKSGSYTDMTLAAGAGYGCS